MSDAVRRVLAAVLGIAVVTVTVLLFPAFDAHSHSAGDTLRPFLLTVMPLWIVGFVVAQALLRPYRRTDSSAGSSSDRR